MAGLLNVDSLKALLRLQKIQAEARAAVKQGNKFIHLVSVRNHPPVGEQVLLLCSEGPRGELLNCQPVDGGKWSVVARYSADRVAAWTKAKIAEIVQ